MTKIIHIYALDFDGCVFNRAYHEDQTTSPEEKVIRYNQVLLNKIKEEQKNADEVWLCIASNRQSENIDKTNALFNKTISCFKALQILSEHLGIPYDDFLLADVYGGLKNGTSFQRALADPNPLNATSPAGWLFDSSKLTIAYGHIHKKTSEAIEKAAEAVKFIYHFFDDGVPILSGLQCFFVQHPNMLPSQVTTRLFEYEGTKLELHSEIKGTGEANASYKKTILEMAEQVVGGPEYKSWLDLKNVHISRLLCVEILTTHAPKAKQGGGSHEEHTGSTESIGESSISVSEREDSQNVEMNEEYTGSTESIGESAIFVSEREDSQTVEMKDSSEIPFSSIAQGNPGDDSATSLDESCPPHSQNTYILLPHKTSTQSKSRETRSSNDNSSTSSLGSSH